MRYVLIALAADGTVDICTDLGDVTISDSERAKQVFADAEARFQLELEEVTPPWE